MSAAIIIKEATTKSVCPITGHQIYPGDHIVRFSKLVRAEMVEQATGALPIQVPADIMDNIMTHSGIMSEASIGKWMKASALPTTMVTKTKSGRILKPVLRHDEREYISGTRDQFDRCYDRGTCYDNGLGAAAINEAHQGENLKGFVVSDNEDIIVGSDSEEEDAEEWDDGFDSEEEDAEEWDGGSDSEEEDAEDWDDEDEEE
jgi:phosphopantothenoylcysteine synthetase/decarboxylase